MFESAPHEPAPEIAAWSASTERPPFARPAPEPGNGLATSSLVLAMVGLLIVIPTLGAGAVISLPFSIAAWVTGTLGRRQVATGQTKAGDGVAHAGIILGVVGVVLGVIGIVVWALLIASGVDPEEFWRDLERGR